MRIVIDIDEDDRTDICNIHFVREDLKFKIGEAIMNGIPLPKGHGRLIDADELKNTFETEEDAEICKWSTYGVTSEIDDADTIIPATEGE